MDNFGKWFFFNIWKNDFLEHLEKKIWEIYMKFGRKYLMAWVCAVSQCLSISSSATYHSCSSIGEGASLSMVSMVNCSVGSSFSVISIFLFTPYLFKNVYSVYIYKYKTSCPNAFYYSDGWDNAKFCLEKFRKNGKCCCLGKWQFVGENVDEISMNYSL